MNEQINRRVALVTECPVHGDPVREHGGGSFTGDSEEKLKRDISREM
jgi:hypothetical protein